MVSYTSPPPVETEPNVPAWTKDGEVSHSGSSEVTHTLNAEYDVVKIVLTNMDGGGLGHKLTMTVNGDTGTNYDLSLGDGSTQSGSASIPMGYINDGNRHPAGEVTLTGRWNDAFAHGWGNFGGAGTANGDTAVSSKNTNVSSPLTQFTLSESQDVNWSGKIEVYGREA